MFYLMSRRFTVSRGWVWKKERDCSIETAQAWLLIFKSDEPDVNFKLVLTKNPTSGS